MLRISVRTGMLYSMRSGCVMPRETTYNRVSRENLTSVLDEVVDQQDTVIIRRRGEPATLPCFPPPNSTPTLLETAHMLPSPRNARRLLTALGRTQRGKTKPGTTAELRRAILSEARA